MVRTATRAFVQSRSDPRAAARIVVIPRGASLAAVHALVAKKTNAPCFRLVDEFGATVDDPSTIIADSKLFVAPRISSIALRERLTLCLVGGQCVGKSELCAALLDSLDGRTAAAGGNGRPSTATYEPTLFAVHERSCTSLDERLLVVHDTGGSSELVALWPEWIANADVLVCVYDPLRPATVERLRELRALCYRIRGERAASRVAACRGVALSLARTIALHNRASRDGAARIACRVLAAAGVTLHETFVAPDSCGESITAATPQLIPYAVRGGAMPTVVVAACLRGEALSPPRSRSRSASSHRRVRSGGSPRPSVSIDDVPVAVASALELGRAVAASFAPAARHVVLRCGDHVETAAFLRAVLRNAKPAAPQF